MSRKREPWNIIKMTISKFAMLNTITKQDNRNDYKIQTRHCSNIGSCPKVRKHTRPHHAWLSHDWRWKSSLSRDTNLLLPWDMTSPNGAHLSPEKRHLWVQTRSLGRNRKTLFFLTVLQQKKQLVFGKVRVWDVHIDH